VKLFCSLWSLGALGTMALGGYVFYVAQGAESPALQFAGVLQLIIGLIQGISVFGLWSARRWGWRTAVTLLWINLALAVLLIVAGDRSLVFVAGVTALFLVYLHARRRVFT
jgi:uncharacterized membrane protein (DUF2068 family)